MEKIESFTEDFDGDANIFAVNPNKNVSTFNGSSSDTDIKDGITIIDTSGKSGSVFGNILGLSGGNSVEATLTETLTVDKGKSFALDFDCFYGYYGTSCNSVVSLKDSSGEKLIEYTWNSKTSNVTDVKIGGVTPSDFTAFRFKSMYSSSSGAKNWSSNPYSLTNTDHTPHVQIIVSSDGNASINFAVPTEGTEVTYNGTLSENFDISALKISTSEKLNADNAVGYDNFVQSIK